MLLQLLESTAFAQGLKVTFCESCLKARSEVLIALLRSASLAFAKDITRVFSISFSFLASDVKFFKELTSSDDIPLKLLEMGCLPGNEVTLLQIAPFSDPLYLNINGSFLAIRKETAALIQIEKSHGETD